MNIVTPIPTAVPFVTSNVNTEAARRDNSQREVIPQPKQGESSAAETGVGSDTDRARPAGLQPQPVTYEKPVPQAFPQSAEDNQGTTSEGGAAQNKQEADADAEDPSAGRESAEQRQREQREQEEERKIQELKERDREVRTHEQAHASVGGQHAGPPQYEFERGPDGKQYAVGGEVSIDISEESTPEKTLEKMNQVKAAALAPNEPSAQDRKVAGEATQKAAEARAEIAQKNAETLRTGSSDGAVTPSEEVAESGVTSAVDATSQAAELENIIFSNNKAPSAGQRRSLDVAGPSGSAAPAQSDDVSADNASASRNLKTPSESDSEQYYPDRDEKINRRAGVIANFYQQVTAPTVYSVQQSA